MSNYEVSHATLSPIAYRCTECGELRVAYIPLEEFKKYTFVHGLYKSAELGYLPVIPLICEFCETYVPTH